MVCPACAAPCGPGVTTACDNCGHVFDSDVTRLAAPVGDADVTRMGAPVGVDSDMTRMGAPVGVDSDMTRMAAPSGVDSDMTGFNADVTGAGIPNPLRIIADRDFTILPHGFINGIAPRLKLWIVYCVPYFLPGHSPAG